MSLHLPHLPPLVVDLAERCHEAGGRALLVGGCVRDHLLHRAMKDWDVEVHGVPEPALATLLRGLGKVSAVGRSFGVYKLVRDDLEIDVSLPRRDSKVGPGHRGIRVEGDPFMGPREAARRRDLTVNAIMLDARTGEILDPWGGLEDLVARRLRAVDEDTFLEDPLRALRVVQFAARLHFAPGPELIALCRRADLHELPAERIQDEWRKLLLGADRPSVGLRIARESTVLQRVFPEAATSDHPEVDDAVDRMAALDLASEGRRYAAMLATWLHRAPPAAVEATLDRLWLHKWHHYPLRERTLDAVACWSADPGDDAALRHLSTRTEVEITLLVRWAVLDDPGVLDRLERARALGVHHEAPARLLLGRHLGSVGIPPGPAMGAVLDHVYERQLDGAITTRKEALAEARRWWSERGE